MKLNEKLATIQTKFKSKKSRFNSFGKYYFRSAEDILEAIKPYLLEHGITVTINEELINDNFDLSPRGIREMLSLNKPIYECTAAYGHFGRMPKADGSFSWEKTDKIAVFKK